MAVPKYKIDFLHKQGLSKDAPLSGLEVDKVIASAQNNREYLLNNLIASTQDVDYNLSIMRKKIYDQRARMIKGEETKENMEYIIDNSIVNLVAKNLPKDMFEISHRKKVKSSGLNINNFIIDVEETFGFDLTNEFSEQKFKRLEDIEKYLSIKAKEQYNATRMKNTNEKQDEIDRNNIISTIDNAWSTFNENLDYIKFQNSMNNLVQNENYDEVHAMKLGFNQAMTDSKIVMLGKMFGKSSTKSREVEQDEVIKEDFSDTNDYQVSDKKAYTNINVRPAKVVAMLGEKIKLVKDKIKYQFELVPVNSVKEIDTVQNIDFEGNNYKMDNNLSIKK